jgi:hypothetical protein
MSGTNTKRPFLQLTLRLLLVGAVVGICFAPGTGQQGALMSGSAKAEATTNTTDANEVPVPELELILVPAMLALVARSGMRSRRRVKAAQEIVA